MTIYAGETARIKATLLDDDGKPVNPVPEDVTLEVLDAEEDVVLQAEADMTLAVEEDGVSTGGSTTTVVDSSKAWAPNEWRDACVIVDSQERRIKSNTATTLTIEPRQVVDEAPIGPFSPAIGSGKAYEIHRGKYRASWNVGSDRADTEAIAIVRATKTGAGAYVSAEKVRIPVEGKAV